jgi:hypothetical protein
LRFEFWLESPLFAALELPRSEWIRVVIALRTVAAGATLARVPRRAVVGLAVARPRLTLTVTSGTSRPVAGFAIAGPGLTLAVTLRSIPTGTRGAIARLAITAPRLTFTVVARSTSACRTP